MLTFLGHKHQAYSDEVLLNFKSDCTEPSTYTPVYSKAQKQVALKENLLVSSAKRSEIFHQTSRQGENEKWFKMRRERITGQICARMIQSSEVFARSILKSMLFTASVNKAAMKLRNEKEQQILVRYKKYILALNGNEVTPEPARLSFTHRNFGLEKLLMLLS